MFCETRLSVPAPNQYAVICAPCREQAYATAERLFKLMKEDTVQILCGCDAADRCPQGRTGADRQCVINVPEDDLFRIVMELPEFKRRYEMQEKNLETGEPMIPSTSDERVTNNVMRHEYKVLNDAEKKQMKDLKDMGLAFHNYLESIGHPSRELSLAKTKIEEAVMWAVKHVTG